MNHQLVLKQVTLVDGRTVDLAIDGEHIAAIGSHLAGDRELDCSNLVALPGFVDLHTHLREPGFEAAETVLTGSRAAAKGGYTAVHPMATRVRWLTPRESWNKFLPFGKKPDTSRCFRSVP